MAKAKETEPPGYLPGMAPKKNKKVHPKAELYASHRDARIAAGKEEKEAKTDLVETMCEEGLEVYEYGDLRVDLTNKRDVKVKIGGQSPAEDEEE